jgi:tyrosyl-tRNA synthetase
LHTEVREKNDTLEKVMDLKILEALLLRPPFDLTHLTAEEQFARIKDKAAAGHSIVTEAALLERLKESKKTGKPLRVKFGIDPTGPQIHVGHAVSLINLRRLLRMGHEIHLIIGDFTAMVGDPGERMDARPPLSAEQVRENMATYAAQASRILDLNAPHVHLHYNSAWLGKHSLSKWLSITKAISVNSLLQREDFRKRLDSGLHLSLAEFEYALLMGYDSVELKPDLEVGGMDQFLNFHFCRQMMEQAGQKPECFLTFDLLPGTTGERDAEGRLGKMSKSRGNYISMEAAPADMYGKVMSIPDEVMWIWYRELTEASSQELAWLKEEVSSGRLHPKEAKQLLARVVVATFHPHEPGAVENAEKDFNSKFGKAAQAVPESVGQVDSNAGKTLADLLKLASGESSSQVLRLVKQKGIHILEGEAYKPIEEPALKSAAGEFKGKYLKIGKLKFYQVV